MADEDLTAKFIREAKERGEPVMNEGTFRVVDDEGHIEVIDPAGPPGASAYPQRTKSELAELAKHVGVEATGTKDDLVRKLVELDENPSALPPEMREFESDVSGGESAEQPGAK